MTNIVRPFVSGAKALPFRSRLDDYIVTLSRGDLAGAARAHFAPDIRLYDNGSLAADGLEAVLRKMMPVLRRFTMLRGTVDDLVCDRAREMAEFACRFDGVDIDGRTVRETVIFRQSWRLGRIVEERQERGGRVDRAFGDDRLLRSLVSGARGMPAGDGGRICA